MNKVATTMFAAIRLSEGREWIDSPRQTREGVEATIRERKENIPQWSSANPVVRISEVEVKEI